MPHPFDLHASGYGPATLVIVVVAILALWMALRSPLAMRWLPAGSGDEIVAPILALPAILFALFTTALASEIWERRHQASEALMRETASVRSLMLLSTQLGPRSAPLERAVRAYVDAVLQREWVAMVRSDHTRKESALPELEALDETVSRLGSDAQMSRYTVLRLHEALETLRVSRLQRLAMAHQPMSTSKWVSCMTLGILTLLTVGVLHAHRRRALGVSLALTGACVVMTLQMLSWHRAAYAGASAVSSSMLAESVVVLDRRKAMGAAAS